jgi:hypothetical protein
VVLMLGNGEQAVSSRAEDGDHVAEAEEEGT